jgi:hemerythrin-like domain-containing protein
MSKAIEDLEHEHQAILFAFKILERMNLQISAGTNPDINDVSDFIGFLREFADKCHHGKEEGILFPTMEKAGLPGHEGLLAALLSEHAKGREWIEAMDAALLSGFKASEFTTAARGYMDLLRAHVEKENNILFPMAERMLTTTQLDALYDAFEEHEAKVIGQGRHEQLHSLLKKLKDKYAAG